MAGVMALGVLFITSYAGAFHDPRPKEIPLGVVAPAPEAKALVAELKKLPGNPVSPRVLGSAEEARQHIMERKLYGALVIEPDKSSDQLLLASAAGPPAAEALRKAVEQFEAAQQPPRSVAATDIVPVGRGDSLGLSAFYLVVGWCVAGYLCASLLAISFGFRMTSMRQAVIRLAALAVYAIGCGLLGTVVIGPILGAMPGSVVDLWWVGALTVFAVGSVTFGFQGVAGVVGIGLTILIVVIAGNPSSGGVYPYPMLPTFWREIGPALPTGAGVWSTRSIAYFANHAMLGPLLTLAAWAAGGTAVTLGATAFHRRQDRKKSAQKSAPSH
ncbi:DUF3533 domain-containing protein [Streptomyces sp. NPDC057115]|uniref:DUF3533 domain-containing protein n=1 Tax=unclassified Streptomyces TaxID=2593676 RepID=UPI003640150A